MSKKFRIWVIAITLFCMVFFMPITASAMNLYEMIQFFELMTNTKAGRQYTEAEIIMFLNEAQMLVYPYMPDTILEYFIINARVRVDSSTFGGTTRISFFERIMGDSLQMDAGIQGSEIYRYLRLYKFSDNVLTTRNFTKYIMTDDVVDILGNALLSSATTQESDDNPIFYRTTGDILTIHGMAIGETTRVAVTALRYPRPMVGFINGVTLDTGAKSMTFNIEAASDANYWSPDAWAGRWLTNYGPNHRSRTRFYREMTNDSQANSLGTGSRTTKIIQGAGSIMFGPLTEVVTTDEFSFDADYPDIVHSMIVMTAAFLARVGQGDIQSATTMDSFIKGVVAPLFQRTTEKEATLPTKRNLQ